MTRSILFVDDEANLIEGIRRVLRGNRADWDICFAMSGQEALRIMETKSFDVVVTDIRMPKMDGVQLLTLVKERHPESVRIILSAHSEKTLIMKTVNLAHQYLAKPIEAATLIGVVGRACAMKDLLSSTKLKKRVSRTMTIPSLPRICTRVLEMLEAPDVFVKDIGAVIAEDPGMSAKILQLVNSAFFGLPKHFTDVTEAVVYLGLDTIGALVLSCSLFSLFDSGKPPEIDALFSHSLRTGAIARKIAIAERMKPEFADEVRLAGLMHDVGILLIAGQFPDDYREIFHRMDETHCERQEAEAAIIGATHAELGACLMGLWGLSTPIVEAIAFHHRPGDCQAAGFQALTAVHAADAFDRGRPQSLDMDYFQRLGLVEHLPAWKLLADGVIEGEEK